MKVVHLSTMDTGGAAVAAQRLHRGLLDEGVASSFVFLQMFNEHQYPNKFKFKPLPIDPSVANRIKRKLGLPITQKERNARLLGELKGKYEVFSFPFTDYRVEEHPLINEADIINLHWISGFINYPTFFEKVKKPIVWTLHDMNPIMGGFHYYGDYERNSNSFGSLESTLQLEKTKVLKHASNLRLISPSTWLAEKTRNSEIMKERKVNCIPYSLDMSIFKPQDKGFARSVFNLPEDKKVILFVSENINNHRKGFDLLVDALEGIDLGKEAVLATIGEGVPLLEKRLPTISLGKIRDERLMSLVYAASDVFVLPSREDNFPNVMLEAMACGTPVISFPVGGMTDVIRNGFNGILASDLNSASLALALSNFVDGKFNFDRLKIRNFANQNFHLKIQAQKYMEIYKQALQGIE